MATKARLTIVLLTMAVSNGGCDIREVDHIRNFAVNAIVDSIGMYPDRLRGSSAIGVQEVDHIANGAVTSLLLPAVQQARETARR